MAFFLFLFFCIECDFDRTETFSKDFSRLTGSMLDI